MANKIDQEIVNKYMFANSNDDRELVIFENASKMNLETFQFILNEECDESMIKYLEINMKDQGLIK